MLRALCRITLGTRAHLRGGQTCLQAAVGDQSSHHSMARGHRPGRRRHTANCLGLLGASALDHKGRIALPEKPCEAEANESKARRSGSAFDLTRISH